LFSLVLFRANAAAAAASARLFYGRSSDADGCADEAELRRAIAARVGYDPIFAIAPNSVSVSITRQGEQIVADVKIADRAGILAGSRTLKAPASQCGELTATIALTVAIALDKIEKATPSSTNEPSGQQAGVPSAPPAEVPPVAPDAPVPPSSFNAFARPEHDAAPAPAPHQSKSAGVPLEFGAGLTAAIGISRAISLGPSVFASLRWPALELGVAGWADLPSASAVDAFPGASVRTSLLAAGPTACLHVSVYFGCALAFVGSFSAEAPGVSGATSDNALTFLGGIRGGAEVPVAFGLSLRGSVDLLANPTAPTVRAGGQDLWIVPPVAATTQVAVALRIP
jgi:hypothetical protein